MIYYIYLSVLTFILSKHHPECPVLTDSKGNPRCITNSKGKKRRVGSKDLQQAVKTCDANFLDFIRRCLE